MDKAALLKESNYLRLELDKLLKRTESDCHGHTVYWYEVAHMPTAYSRLVLAKLWLGKFNAALGFESPYKVATDVNAIPKPVVQAERPTHTCVGTMSEPAVQLELMNKLRLDIATLIAKAENLRSCPDVPVEGYMGLIFASSYMTEARMMLGLAIGNIPDRA